MPVIKYSFMEVQRVIASDEALQLIRRLNDLHGPLMFHQSGGCCDGSQPMCFPLGEFRIGDADVLLGYLDGHPFYMAADQFAYWQHTQLIIDVSKGRGSSFSLEIPLGLRFLLRSRIFTDAELEQLMPVRAGRNDIASH